MELAERHRHLEGRSTGGREEHARNAEALLQEPRTELRIPAVARTGEASALCSLARLKYPSSSGGGESHGGRLAVEHHTSHSTPDRGSSVGISR